MMNIMKLNYLMAVFLVVVFSLTATGQSTAFSYQGSLTNAGTAANGNFDFEFLLFDNVSAGTQLGTTQQKNNLAVAGGVFSVSLDFGNQFSSAGNRYLEIRVRPSGGGAFTALSPRQQLAASPYAVRTISADIATNAANLNNQPASFYQNASNLASGTIPDARLGSNVALKSGSNSFSGQNFFTSNANEFRGDGANLTNLNASQVLFGSIGDGFLSSNIPKLNAANNFANQNNFAFGGRTLQFRNDSGLVPGLNLTGTTGNLGILRIRNALEIWPSDDTTRAGKIDIRNNAGSPTVTLNGANGTIDAANMSAFKGVQTFRDPRSLEAGIDVPAGTFADLESFSIIVPSNGYLVITATANVGLLNVSPIPGYAQAWFKLEETSSGSPVQLIEVGKTVFVSTLQIGTVETLTISWSIPVTAGTRSFKTVLTVPGTLPAKVWSTTLNAIYIGRVM